MNLKLRSDETGQVVLNTPADVSAAELSPAGRFEAYKAKHRVSCSKCTNDTECHSLGKARLSGNYSLSQRAAWARESDPKRFILYRLKQNAKVRDLEFALTLADIPETPSHCPVFPWIALEHKVGAGRSDSSPSVDRIDNRLGYIPGNIRIISHRANLLKGDATDAELLHLGQDVERRT